MRYVAAVIIFASSLAHADPESHWYDPPQGHWFISGTIGVHRTVVDGDAVLVNYGPRAEIVGRFSPHPMVSLAVVGAITLYSDDHVPLDEFDQPPQFASLHVTDYWFGARVLFHPFSPLWVGGGRMVLIEHTSSDSGSRSSHYGAWEFSAGLRLPRVNKLSPQIEVTGLRYYYAPGNPQNTSMWTLGIGAEY